MIGSEDRRRMERQQLERRQFDHEHNRLWKALEETAQIAELAGHDILAASLRRERRDVAAEQRRGACTERP